MKILILTLISLSALTAYSRGSCPCPFDIDKRGYKCGKRSSFCRQGGDEPMCGAKNGDQVKKMFSIYCR